MMFLILDGHVIEANTPGIDASRAVAWCREGDSAWTRGAPPESRPAAPRPATRRKVGAGTLLDLKGHDRP